MDAEWGAIEMTERERERQTGRDCAAREPCMYVLLWGSAAADRQSVGGTVQLVFGADRELMSSC